jgi:carbonic anhydrase
MWLVLKTPVEISDAQIDQFAHFYKHNARPVQPLSGRVVSESP